MPSSRRWRASYSTPEGMSVTRKGIAFTAALGPMLQAELSGLNILDRPLFGDQMVTRAKDDWALTGQRLSS